MQLKSKKAKPEPRECECGCGEMTSGSRFRQGHDARLKAALIKSALSGSKRAAQKLETLGWTKFLEAKRAGLPDIPRSKRQRRIPKEGASAVADAPAAEPFRVFVSLDSEGTLPEAITGEGLP